MIRTKIFFLVALLFFSPCLVLANRLITLPIKTTNTHFGILDSVIISLYIDTNVSLWQKYPEIFNNISWRSVNHSTDLYLNKNFDLDYSTFIESISNGRDEYLIISFDFNGSSSTIIKKESEYFFEKLQRVDFVETRIQSIFLRVNTIVFDLWLVYIGGVPLFFTQASVDGLLGINIYNTIPPYHLLF